MPVAAVCRLVRDWNVSLYVGLLGKICELIASFTLVLMVLGEHVLTRVSAAVANKSKYNLCRKTGQHTHISPGDLSMGPRYIVLRSCWLAIRKGWLWSTCLAEGVFLQDEARSHSMLYLNASET